MTAGNGYLTAESILAATDLPRHEVDLTDTEWRGKVLLRVLTGTERDAWELAQAADKNGKANRKNVRARMVAYCLINADGQRLFKDEHIDQLGKKSGAILDRLFDECLRINGMSEKGQTETEKNSEAPLAAEQLSG